MGEKIYFLRHARTQVNSIVPPSEWLLSTKGNEEAQLKITLENVLLIIVIIFLMLMNTVQ